MEASLTTIPWSFVAAFAEEMLSAVTQHGLAIALYDGYYGSPASCGLGEWAAFFATAAGDNLVHATLYIYEDKGHFIAPNRRLPGVL